MQRRTLLQSFLGTAVGLALQPAWAAALADSQAQGFSVRSLGFSPSGELLAAGGSEQDKQGQGFEGTIRIYDTRSGKEVSQLKGHGQCSNGVYFVNEEKLISWGSEELNPDSGSPRDQRIRIWSLPEKRFERDVRLDDRYPSQVLYHARQAEYQLYWSCADGILLWRGGRNPERMLSSGQLRGLSLDGQRVLYEEGGQLHIFEVPTRKRKDVREGSPSWSSGLPLGGWVTYDAKNGYQTFNSEMATPLTQTQGTPPRASCAQGNSLIVVQERGLLVFGDSGTPRAIDLALPAGPYEAAIHPASGRLACAPRVEAHPHIRWLDFQLGA